MRNPSLAALVPILAIVLAWALLVQAPSANQTSHYALIRALASGTAKIDPYASETIDKSLFKGHLYSNKAPGLALAAAPIYLLLDKTGLAAVARRAASHLAATVGARAKSGAGAKIRADRGIIWVLTLWAVILPATVLLVLLRAVAERIQPGLWDARRGRAWDGDAGHALRHAALFPRARCDAGLRRVRHALSRTFARRPALAGSGTAVRSCRAPSTRWQLSPGCSAST